jgi:hypothetical protein
MEKISGVIHAAIQVIEKTVEGVKVKILSQEMTRLEPTEHYPLGQLGVEVEFSWEIGEENVQKVKTFLPYQLCEDMLNPLGNLIAEEIVFTLYRDIFEKMEKELDL